MMMMITMMIGIMLMMMTTTIGIMIVLVYAILDDVITHDVYILCTIDGLII